MATIKDVAREAGVSTATVSRVLNKSGYMSEEAVNKVNKAMETLSYHPNAVARSLVRGKHNSIGVMFPYLSIPFWAVIYVRCFGRENKVKYFGINLILGLYGN